MPDAPPTRPPASPPTGTSRRTLVLSARSAAVGTVVTYAINLAILPFVLHRVGADLYGAWATIAVGARHRVAGRHRNPHRDRPPGGGGQRGRRPGRHSPGRARGAHPSRRPGRAVLLTLGFVGAPLVRGFAFPGGVPGHGAAEVDLAHPGHLRAARPDAHGVNGYFGVLRGVQRGDIESTARTLAVPSARLSPSPGSPPAGRLWALFFWSRHPASRRSWAGKRSPSAGSPHAAALDSSASARPRPGLPGTVLPDPRLPAGRRVRLPVGQAHALPLRRGGGGIGLPDRHQPRPPGPRTWPNYP